MLVAVAVVLTLAVAEEQQALVVVRLVQQPMLVLAELQT
jgi:hypothetical protein